MLFSHYKIQQLVDNQYFANLVKMYSLIGKFIHRLKPLYEPPHLTERWIQSNALKDSRSGSRNTLGRISLAATKSETVCRSSLVLIEKSRIHADHEVTMAFIVIGGHVPPLLWTFTFFIR
jgi:hypothetical protein